MVVACLPSSLFHVECQWRGVAEVRRSAATGNRMKDLLNLFQANPARGVVAHGRLLHWHELLEEWCMVHERCCRLAKNDAIFWQSERSNLAALAGAAWRSGWAALEEFPHDKMANRSKFSGRPTCAVLPLAEARVR
jgi:hypothetical protein